MTQVKIVKATRLASALVKKGQFDNAMIRRIVATKAGVKLKPATIAGIQRSHRYQIGKAISLVMQEQWVSCPQNQAVAKRELNSGIQ